MRAVAYIVMVGIVVAGLISGEIGLALAAGGAKAAIVGLEYMELRHAARPHLVGFMVFAAALTVLLAVLTAL